MSADQGTPTRAEAQKWLIDRGVTPSEEEAQRTAARLMFAYGQQNEAPGARVKARVSFLQQRITMLGFALGYDEEPVSYD